MNKYLENLISYVAENNPRGVNKLAYKYGFMPPVSREGREGFLFTGISEEGDGFLKSIARYHPDKELILSAHYADGSDGAGTEPNIINLKDDTTTVVSSSPEKKPDTDTIKIALMLFVAFILYKILYN
jgi:hypothetical protein